MILILIFLGTVSGVPLPEPLYVKSIKGIPIKGKHPPIGPGTDKGLYNIDMFEGDILLSQQEPDNKNAITEKSLLWPHGAVAYKVEDNVGCPESPQCELLMKAMDNYHEKSCIRFKEWTGEDNFVQVFFNHENSGACWSPVGRVGATQRLSLGFRCWYLGIVIHELGHAVGFWHEMNRPDRDNYIYIYWKNILPEFASAFAKQSSNVVSNLGEKFDIKSVMMYDEYAFSKDGVSPTIQTRNGAEIGPLWRKHGLSNADIRKIHKLYSCDGTKQKDGFPLDMICNFNSHTCGFHNGGSSVWSWRVFNETDGYVYSSYETAGTTPGFLMSVNFHAIDPDDRRPPLGCLRFWYLLQSDGTSSLMVAHSYLKKVTQLKHDPETTFELWMNDTILGKWVHVEVPLYITRPFKLMFQSEFKDDNTYGTIALDDVELFYTECRGEGDVVAEVLKSSDFEVGTSYNMLQPSVKKSMHNILKKKKPLLT